MKNATQYAPVLAPSSGLHWARRRARDHAAERGEPVHTVKPLHIADRAGRLICDAGPSVSRGVEEPTLQSQVHGVCLHVLRRMGVTW